MPDSSCRFGHKTVHSHPMSPSASRSACPLCGCLTAKPPLETHTPPCSEECRKALATESTRTLPRVQR